MNAAEKRKQMAELARIEAKKRADVAEIARKARPGMLEARFQKAKAEACARIDKQLRGNSVEVGFSSMERDTQHRLYDYLVAEGYTVSTRSETYQDCGHDQGDKWYDNGYVTSTIFTIRW